MLAANGILANTFGGFEAFCRARDGNGDGGGGARKDLPVFLSSTELADMLQMSPRTLEGMRLDGRGPKYVRLGKGGKAKVLYLLSDVEDWINAHRR